MGLKTPAALRCVLPFPTFISSKPKTGPRAKIESVFSEAALFGPGASDSRKGWKGYRHWYSSILNKAQIGKRQKVTEPFSKLPWPVTRLLWHGRGLGIEGEGKVSLSYQVCLGNRGNVPLVRFPGSSGAQFAHLFPFSIH